MKQRTIFPACVLTMILAAGMATGGQTPPATAPATAPVTMPAIHVVAKGDLKLDIRGEGFFQARDAFDVRIRLRSYSGPLVISSIAPHMSSAKKGDVLIAFEPVHMKWALESAENELATAVAALQKAEAEAQLAVRTEALSLRIAEDSLKQAEEAVKWWQTVDGPHMLLSADLAVTNARNYVEDQSDELDQLRKMYKAEDLTTATADIVIKRAVRRLENAKISLKMQEERREKTRTSEYKAAEQRVRDAVEQARNALESLKIAQAHAAVTRKAGLAGARIAVEQAQRKVDDLKADAAAMTVTAPFDGTVMYGQIVDGQWQGGDVRALRPGERATAGQVLMRLVKPGHLTFEATVPEHQALWIQPGAKVVIVPGALAPATIEAKCPALMVVSRGTPGALAFKLEVPLEEADARLLPGMKGSFQMEITRADVLCIPASAVSAGMVTFKRPDGSTEKRRVTLGMSDGKNVEVIAGLVAGDCIVLPESR